MKALQGANLALRFCLELTALGILGRWGWSTGEGARVRVGAVQVEERPRDQEHRHEREQQRSGAWMPTTTTSEPTIAASV